MDIIIYLTYGKTSEETKNTIPEIRATFLSLVSRVFLLPYSLPPAIQPIPNPRPPFGDISKTDPINAIHERINITIKTIRMFFYNKNKVPDTIYIWLWNSTITKIAKNRQILISFATKNRQKLLFCSNLQSILVDYLSVPIYRDHWAMFF